MISVVMPSFLGHYHGAATNRDEKFIRAVDSFLAQGIGELIVVADGCEMTEKIIRHEYANRNNIRLVTLPKQSTMSGKVRQAGITAATHAWITYLDSDDEYGDGHLLSICDGIASNLDADWLYWDDFVGDHLRKCDVSQCRIGTSCIAHKKSIHAIWTDGYMHDWGFITRLGKNYTKINGPRYIVHHIPGKIDN